MGKKAVILLSNLENIWFLTENLTQALVITKQSNREATLRDIRLDFGRCFAALCVIYIHCSDIYLWRYDDKVTWYFAALLSSASRFAVPLFIMSSGALLVGREIADPRAYFKRRFLATAKPFLFGTVFYLLFQWLYPQGPTPTPSEYIHNLLTGSPYYHLYFLPVLFGIYIVSPFFQGLTPKMAPGVIVGLTVVFLELGVQRYLLPNGFTLGSFISVTIFLPYFVAGYACSKMVDVPAKTAAWIYLGATASTFLLVSIASARANGRAGNAFLEYDSLTIIVQSLAIFCLLQKIRIKSAKLVAAVSLLARLALGIYILHAAVLAFLINSVSSQGLLSPALVMAFVPIATFLVCAALVQVLHLVPGVKGFL